MNTKIIATRIKELRSKKDISRKALALAAGVGYSTVASWENGVTLPKVSGVVILSKLFGVKSDYILGVID